MVAWLDENLRQLHEQVKTGNKMTSVLFRQFKVGIPGRITDGIFGPAIRKATGYNEKTMGPARRAEYDKDQKAGFPA